MIQEALADEEVKKALIDKIKVAIMSISSSELNKGIQDAVLKEVLGTTFLKIQLNFRRL